MLLALCVAVIATGLGVALAVLPAASARLLGPIRTFTLTASLAVVLTHLVPEASAALGAPALAVLALGAIIPPLLEAVARKFRRSTEGAGRSRLGLEAGYAGLLVHQLADGLGLGAGAGPLGHGQPEVDVLIALAAHTVPVVAVVVLAFGAPGAPRAGLWRAAGLACAMGVGVVMAGLVPAASVMSATPWVAAGASGLLLHVVMHDLGSKPPRTSGARTVDLGAALLGFLVPAAGGLLASDGVEHDPAWRLAGELGRSCIALTLDTAPLLLVGLFAGALIQSFGSRIPARWLTSRGPALDALRGAVVGAPLPLCSCSVLPVSRALAKRAGPALVVAFLISTPELGVETFALSVRFLGWPFAFLRLAGALAIAIVAGLVVARALGSTGRAETAASTPPAEAPPTSSGNPVRRTLAAFDELLHHIGAWMVIGIVAAAVVEALIPAEAFAAIDHPLLELAIVTLIAIPNYVCAASATPLAAVLIAKGVSPGAVLVGLLLGPTTNLATLAFLRSTYGVRATLLCVSAVVSLAWAVALLTNRVLPTIDVHAHSVIAHESYGAPAIAASVLLAVLLLRSIWLAGTRAWLASLGDMGVHDHSHHHGHDHAHDHGHEHPHAHDHSHGHAHGHGHDHSRGHGHAHGHGHRSRGHGHVHGHGRGQPVVRRG